MFKTIENKGLIIFKKSVAWAIIGSFCMITIFPPQIVQAQIISNLPAPGIMVKPSIGFIPAIMTGMTIHPSNPMQFDFIIDRGDDFLEGAEFEQEAKKLINYFLTTLTVPEDELWVNLSPYEKDKIIADGLGITEMGRDMLTQDYLLKQLTASLMYPEDELGGEFWKRVYERAYEEFGTTDIPTNTFNKIWITPEKASVYINGNSVFVVESHLKVMLEEDYLALEQHTAESAPTNDQDDWQESEVSANIVREILIPEIEREVNEGKNFSQLRQIFHSMILAAWYKQNLKTSLLSNLYVDQNKVLGIDLEDKDVKEKVYNQYLQAFKQGVFNYIKEDYDPATQDIIPRKYFSGGIKLKQNIPSANVSIEWMEEQDAREQNSVSVDLARLSRGVSVGLATLATAISVFMPSISSGEMTKKVFRINMPTVHEQIKDDLAAIEGLDQKVFSDHMQNEGEAQAVNMLFSVLDTIGFDPYAQQSILDALKAIGGNTGSQEVVDLIIEKLDSVQNNPNISVMLVDEFLYTQGWLDSGRRVISEEVRTKALQREMPLMDRLLDYFVIVPIYGEEESIVNIFENRLDNIDRSFPYLGGVNSLLPEYYRNDLSQKAEQMGFSFTAFQKFFEGLVFVESSERVDVTSNVGATGLVQIMPAMFEAIVRQYGLYSLVSKKYDQNGQLIAELQISEEDRKNPEANATVGAYMLFYLLERSTRMDASVFEEQITEAKPYMNVLGITQEWHNRFGLAAATYIAGETNVRRNRNIGPKTKSYIVDTFAAAAWKLLINASRDQVTVISGSEVEAELLGNVSESTRVFQRERGRYTRGYKIQSPSETLEDIYNNNEEHQIFVYKVSDDLYYADLNSDPTDTLPAVSAGPVDFSRLTIRGSTEENIQYQLRDMLDDYTWDEVINTNADQIEVVRSENILSVLLSLPMSQMIFRREGNDIIIRNADMAMQEFGDILIKENIRMYRISATNYMIDFGISFDETRETIDQSKLTIDHVTNITTEMTGLFSIFSNASSQIAFSFDDREADAKWRKEAIQAGEKFFDLKEYLGFSNMFGSVVTNGDQGILIIGHQNSGKSLWLLKFLEQNPEWRLAAMDQVSGGVFEEQLIVGPGSIFDNVTLEGRELSREYVSVSNVVVLTVDKQVTESLTNVEQSKEEALRNQQQAAVDLVVKHDSPELFAFPSKWLNAIENLSVTTTRWYPDGGVRDLTENFEVVINNLKSEQDDGKLTTSPGGIDLNPNNFKLEEEGGIIQMDLPIFDPQLFVEPIEGLKPVIINIAPVVNFPLLLGFVINEEGDFVAVPKRDPIYYREEQELSKI